MDLRLEAAIAEGYRLRAEFLLKKEKEERAKKLTHYSKWAPIAQKWIDEELFTIISESIGEDHSYIEIKLDGDLDILRYTKTIEESKKLYECIAYLVSEIDGLHISPIYINGKANPANIQYGGCGYDMEFNGYKICWKK